MPCPGRGRVFLPAAFETPFRVGSPARPAGIGDHDLGVASTSVRVVVQASPRRSVTRIGVPRSWSFSGSAATRSPSSTEPLFLQIYLFVFRARGIADRLHAGDIGIRDIRQILNPLRAFRHALNRRVLQRERSCSTQEYLAVG